jgi:hypothetical protein
MSDLNDAIREHLALKRLHGADPADVARLEEEALGEVTRETARELSHEQVPRRFAVEDLPAREEEDPVSGWEEISPPTNEYAPTRARAIGDVGDETQEYSVEDQIGWIGSPAWQGGAA